MAALRRSSRLAQVLRRIKIKLLFAMGAAEVISLPFVIGLSSGCSRFYLHAAHRIFHRCCGLHCHLSFVRASGVPVQFSNTARGFSRSFPRNRVASPGRGSGSSGFLGSAWRVPVARLGHSRKKEEPYALANAES